MEQSNTTIVSVQVAGANEAKLIKSQRYCCLCLERPIVFGAADSKGNAIAGGLCRECIPTQQPEDAGLAEEHAFRLRYQPSSLELVEQISNEADVARGLSVFTPAELDAVDESSHFTPRIVEPWAITEADLDRWLSGA